jgi:hypothetical protein
MGVRRLQIKSVLLVMIVNTAALTSLENFVTHYR